MIQFVKKRDGRTIAFNSDRITRAIFLAASKVAEKENSSADYSVSEKITQDVISLLNSKYANSIPGVEDIQDVVVKLGNSKKYYLFSYHHS